MCWDEYHDDDVDALTKRVFWNPDRGDQQNMTGYDNKRLDGRNKKKQYGTAVRIYEYTAAAVPVRTQGNGTPPGKLWGGIYIPISRITSSNEIMKWLIYSSEAS